MPITAAIIGGAVAIASTAASITANQIAASKQARAQQRMRAALEADESKSRHELEREENESALERADVRLGLTEAKETLDRQSDAARGQAAVMGTTNAGVAAQKEAAQRAFAEAQAKTIAAGEAAKQQRIDKKEEQLMGIHKEQRNADYEAEMQNIQNMQQSVASAGQMAQSAAGLATSIAQATQASNAGIAGRGTVDMNGNTTSDALAKVREQGVINAAKAKIDSAIAANNKVNSLYRENISREAGKWARLFSQNKAANIPTNKP